jgi:hypothetical protein
MAVPGKGRRRASWQVIDSVAFGSEEARIQPATFAAASPEVCRLVVNMPTRLLY